MATFRLEGIQDRLGAFRFEFRNLALERVAVSFGVVAAKFHSPCDKCVDGERSIHRFVTVFRFVSHVYSFLFCLVFGFDFILFST